MGGDRSSKLGHGDDSTKVVLGKIGKVHGIKGWLRLNSFTAPPENILDYPQLSATIGQNVQVLEVDDSKQQPNGLLVHFTGYDVPETARVLTGLEVWVDSSALPALEADTYYWHELMGMAVSNEQGQLLGEVSDMLETGANDVMVVSATERSIDDRERLIPYLKDAVIKSVDRESKVILVDWDASYLE
jgi:16S rRNA processing protein RimM